jgi:uncharacterized protein (DUF433 family)
MENIAHIYVDSAGAPRTISKNVKVGIIAAKFLEGDASAEDIAAHYGISPADVFAALTYYHDHKNWFVEREKKNREILQTQGKSLTDFLNKLKT